VFTVRVISEYLHGDQSGLLHGGLSKLEMHCPQPWSDRAFRTRIGDLPYYTGDMARVEEIPTKEFADKIAVRLTDVRILSI